MHLAGLTSAQQLQPFAGATASAVESHEKVAIPADAARVDWRDEVFNLPSLLYEGPYPKDAIARMLAACRDMFTGWRNNGSSAVVTVTVGLNVGEIQLWMSCAGRLGPMLRWLEHPAVELPTRLADMREWCNRAQKALRELFPDSISAPGIEAVSALIRRSGSLRFRRMFVEPGSWEIEQTKLGRRIVAVPPPADAADIVTRGYRPLEAIEVVRSTCIKCGRPFIECPCAAVEGGEKVEDMNIFALAWGRPSVR